MSEYAALAPLVPLHRSRGDHDGHEGSVKWGGEIWLTDCRRFWLMKIGMTGWVIMCDGAHPSFQAWHAWGWKLGLLQAAFPRRKDALAALHAQLGAQGVLGAPCP